MNGVLWITNEQDGTQVKLTPEAIKALIEYLYSVPEGNDPGEARDLVRYILN